jgi:ureidoacrylate peracid hydrolase
VLPAWELVKPIQELAGRCRADGIPVVYTEYVYSEAVPILLGRLHPEHLRAAPGAPRGFGIPSSCCLEGEANVQTIQELQPEPGELVVRKHWYDAFHGTALDGALRARNVRNLIVTGIMTDICVFATVVGAFNREYRMVVVEDAVATLWPEIQRATLDIMGRAYARLAKAAEVQSEIARWRR